MKTLVIGASENTARYANRAAQSLLQHGHAIELIGLKAGQIQGYPIQTGLPTLNDVDTVTMYVGARNQAGYVDYLKDLKPRRVIFNPGAENPELAQQLKKEGIEPIEACTLVMLSIGNY
ncbi:CoA-binding protein [Fibrella forsythiae]|uniref:CoA-binding protein n=1 Tax=Fibrella forsythiae TaxID=2817061 RepID=A0ABS3JGG6_9BACT|nr:CoA-binding protein [Fibrella forsythiae]MBO0949106.1 CoA-binding protein [Fibrella forsythiae]